MRLEFIKFKTFSLIATIVLVPANLLAFPSVTINSVCSEGLAGPIHHGLVVETSGIDDPNLSHYEVQIKPDSGGPFPPWKVYSAVKWGQVSG